MQHRVPNPIWEAAKLLQPPDVSGSGLMDPKHCWSGGILLSCRSPDFQGVWPLLAPSPDEGA